MHIAPTTTENFLYLKQILFSQNVLKYLGVGHESHIPFFYINVTAFAKQFILYIKEGNK